MDGKYFLSNFHDSKSTALRGTAIRFGPSKKKNEFNVPGPGLYNQPATITGQGTYFVSRFKSSLCRKFTHSRRESLIDCKKGNLVF